MPGLRRRVARAAVPMLPGPLSRFPGHSFIDGAWREVWETWECRGRGSRAAVPAFPGPRCPRCPGHCHGARSSRAIHSFTWHGGRRGSAVAALTVPAVPEPRCCVHGQERVYVPRVLCCPLCMRLGNIGPFSQKGSYVPRYVCDRGTTDPLLKKGESNAQLLSPPLLPNSMANRPV